MSFSIKIKICQPVNAMSLELILRRVAVYSTDAVVADIMRSHKLRMSKKKEVAGEVFFFRGDYAELEVLHTIMHASRLQTGLLALNKFRSDLMSQLPPESRTRGLDYALCCGQRLSGQDVYTVLQGLGVPSVVVFARTALGNANVAVKFLIMLEQGGCRLVVKPNATRVRQACRGRIFKELSAEEN